MSLVKDAMVPDPPWRRPTRARRRRASCWRDRKCALYSCDDDEGLTGVVTRKTLVREVVAPGLHPRETPLGEIAEEPYYTIDASEQLDGAFRFLEEHDAERCRWLTVGGSSGAEQLGPATPTGRGRGAAR